MSFAPALKLMAIRALKFLFQPNQPAAFNHCPPATGR